jgi:hypothetical protein
MEDHYSELPVPGSEEEGCMESLECTHWKQFFLFEHLLHAMKREVKQAVFLSNLRDPLCTSFRLALTRHLWLHTVLLTPGLERGRFMRMF